MKPIGRTEMAEMVGKLLDEASAISDQRRQ